MSPVSLREYQTEFVDNAVDALAGDLSPISGFSASTHASSPTGTGKTRMGGSVIERRSTEGPALFLAHRDPLVRQNAAALQDTFGASVVIEKAEITELQDARPGSFDVACASVQTLYSRPEVLEACRFGTIVLDETHTAFSPQYQSVIEQIAKTSPGAALLGVTATSFRSDGADFSTLFGSHCFHRDLLWALRESWLKPMKVTRVDNEPVVDRILRLYAPGGEIEAETGHHVPVILPAQNVERGRQIADELRQRGVEAYMVDSLDGGDGKTHEILERYKRREFPVLCAYSQIMEGFDAPHASAILWERNTESPVLFLQGLGRVERPDPQLMQALHGEEAWARFNTTTDSAERATLMTGQIAYVDEYYDFDAPNATRIYTVAKAVGFHAGFDYEGTDALETTERGRYVADTYGVSTTAFNSASHIEHVVERRDELERLAGVSDVPDTALLVWAQKDHEYTFILEHDITLKTTERAAPDTPVDINVHAFVKVFLAPSGQWTATVERPERYWMWFKDDDEWKLRRHTRWTSQKRPNTYYTGEEPEDRLRFIHDPGVEPRRMFWALSRDDVFRRTELWIQNSYPDQYDLNRADASWRSHSLSRGQERVLEGIRKKRIPVPNGLTKGAASHLISKSFSGYIEPWAPVARGTGVAVI